MTSLGGARVIPQTYEWLDGHDQLAVQRILRDDRFAEEQKFDGMRCLVRLGSSAYDPDRPLRDDEILFFSHGGRPLVQAAAAQHFAALRAELRTFGAAGEIVLDGELMTDRGELWLFDMPFCARGVGSVWVSERTPFRTRRQLLEVLVATMRDNGIERVRLVPQARGTQAKTDLLQAVMDSASEGVCFKDLEATYDWSGNRVKTVLKLKVKRTVDCVVVARDVGMAENVRGEIVPVRNAHLEVYTPDGEAVPLGSTSMNGKPDARPGQVVEVEYLSWKVDGHLVQPNLLRVRDDKLPSECRVGQLVPSNKEVLEVLGG